MSEIYLHSDPGYSGLLNTHFSPFSYDGREYRTAEHLFQALKFTDEKHVLDIQQSDNPLTRAHQLEPPPNAYAKVQRRADWYEVNKIMLKIALYHKFTHVQQNDLKELLLSTGSRKLLNNVADRHWGIGQSRKGGNQFGEVLMEVRNELAQLKPLEVPKIPRLPTLRNPIRFYDSKDPYYVFTNFAEATVLFDGKTWKTSEHLFQAWKFTDKPHIQLIFNLAKASDVFKIGRSTQGPPIRADWEDIKIDVMTYILYQKFNGAHCEKRYGKDKDSYQETLLGTAGIELIEDSDKDAFWGVGPNGKGQNQLGKALVRVRDIMLYGFDRPTEPPNPPRFTGTTRTYVNAVASSSRG